MKILYVSPHPDDVAFSAAGRLLRDVGAGHDVAVITLFAPRAGGSSAVLSDAEARRAEDDRFAAAARVTSIAGGFVDAIARRPRYQAPRHLFGPLQPDEDPLVAEVRARLQSLVDGGYTQVLAPLGVGQHVDHQVAHAAARQLVGADVLFYEDTPYVLTPFQLPRRIDRLRLAAASINDADRTLARGGAAEELSAAARAWLAAPLLRELAKPPHHVLALGSILVQSELWHWPRRAAHTVAHAEPEILESDELAARKLESVSFYDSQWRIFHASLERWRESLEAYGRRMGRAGVVERAWRIR